MFRSVSVWALVICVAAGVTAEAVGQEVLPQSGIAAPSLSNPAGDVQMAATHMIPAGARIDLMAAERVSSLWANVGDPVHFVVTDPVLIDGFVLIPAGTQLLGTITKVTRAKLHHRDGRLDIRIEDLRIGKELRLSFVDHPPAPPLTPEEVAANRKARHHLILGVVVWSPLIAALLPVEIPYVTLMAIAMWNEGGPPSGVNSFLPRCAKETIYVKAPVRIEMAALIDAEKNAAAPSQIPCTVPESYPESWRFRDGFPGVIIR
jgi:hypothetical protein